MSRPSIYPGLKLEEIGSLKNDTKVIIRKRESDYFYVSDVEGNVVISVKGEIIYITQKTNTSWATDAKKAIMTYNKQLEEQWFDRVDKATPEQECVLAAEKIAKGEPPTAEEQALAKRLAHRPTIIERIKQWLKI